MLTLLTEKKIGKSDRWVSSRLSLVTKLSDYVRGLLEKGKLTSDQASRIFLEAYKK